MSVNLAQAAWDGLISGLLGLKNIVIIVLPLMIFIEAAKDSGVMERITARFHGVATSPKMLETGFSYGSGVIISAAKDGDLSLKDRYAIAIFLSICHSIFEDTLIFVAIGASVSWLMGSRLILAILATLLFGRLPMATSPKMLETGISTDLS